MTTNRPRTRLTLAAVLLATVFSGCATTVGTLAGPVTGPVSVLRNTWGMPRWLLPVTVPLAVGVGPFLGFFEGVRCDVWAVRNGGYGKDGAPAFDKVFDPVTRESERRIRAMRHLDER